MLILGLTGSIGMGKSTAARFFAEAGVPVYDADAAVHRLYVGEAVGPIEKAFPGTVIDGKVDRVKLAAQVLDDPAALKRLEAIVHPLVRAQETQFLAAAATRGATVVVLDIPLLFEVGGEERVDAVVVVSASAELQRERVLTRTDMSEGKLDAILAKQTPDEEKRRRAHFVVDSSRSFDSARAQIHGILRAVAAMPGRRRDSRTGA
jgi:dephospho-CoA kinase